MEASRLRALVPDASVALCDILSDTRGPLQAPIRSELFGLERFAQHGRSLGESHHTTRSASRWASFFPQLRENIDVLRQAHQYIGAHAGTGYDISPAAEWLLDNFHLIDAQLREIHEGLPHSYFRGLPILTDEPLVGLPRIYGVAWAFVAHTDGAFDETLLIQFLNSYQESHDLNLGEAWALPTTLRVVLIENLRRLAERVAANKAARELANLCCEQLDNHSIDKLNELLGALERRGVGRTFLAQMAQRLLDRRMLGDAQRYGPYQDWLRGAVPDAGAARAQQTADQAADNLSVSNAVVSLRAIGDADWSEIVARSSRLMRLMLSSKVFEAEETTTRDQTLHAIERLAHRARCGEVALAQTLLDLMHSDSAADASLPGYWLSGAGQTQLWRALGLRPNARFYWQALVRHGALAAYLGALLIGTSCLVIYLLQLQAPPTAWNWVTLLGAAVMLFPASETVLSIINRLISESIPPHQLPRLALQNGIPPEHRVVVVIPALLTSPGSVRALVNRLHLHYLANPEPEAQFALLSDWADADSLQSSSDQPLLTQAARLLSELNTRHPVGPAQPERAPRFLLLHRERTFCETEQRWMGWERKRGKLEQLIDAASRNSTTAFLDLGTLSQLATQTRYIVTLDSDTVLPPGRLRELVGVAAHPQNQPRLAADGRSIVSGYAILQPCIATPLPTPQEWTLYHWLFAGQCGIDPYSAASSEVYQDLFHEGSFTGKGLLNVAALQAVLAKRLPSGQVLSHDLIEGALTRCATLSDLTLLEEAPFHSDVAASRLHRWTRGDWQLLPFLLSAKSFALRPINRWKIFDNLRRSLVAPMSLALILLSLAGVVVSPQVALSLVFSAFVIGPLMGAVAALAPSRGHVALDLFYRQAGANLLRALGAGLWHLCQLLQDALASVDAIARALYRLLLSRRHLLQWTTAAAAQAQVKSGLLALSVQHWREPGLALLLLATLLMHPNDRLPLAVLLTLVWAASPLWTWLASRPQAMPEHTPGWPQDKVYLEGVARDTWRYFERCVHAGENHLPPDNLQMTPHEIVAHRTSPTNIGLYLLSVACAREFGWIGTQELLARLEATLQTVQGLPRHRGHLLNWYDTERCAPLLPMYVSSVDSGNLSAHLLALAEACAELAGAPYDLVPLERALRTARQRLSPLLRDLSELAPDLPLNCALARLLASDDALRECRQDPVAAKRLVAQARVDLTTHLMQAAEASVNAAPTRHNELAWCLGDYISTLDCACTDVQAISGVDGSGADGPLQAKRRLLALATRCEKLAWEADFSFLYHPKRHLLHIGYRVAEQQLDAGFYDLLASESRLTSLLAIAKGDLPVRHWAALGRPSFASGAKVGLRSWAGSMFEYLMPGLVLREPRGSVLDEACQIAILTQIDFALSHNTPWGISESAYAASDHTLAYQYAPQGVPTLALRRIPVDELVIAPYATAMAAALSARAAVLNFERLEGLQARARYGFIEALDFSPARQLHGERFTQVSTFMAHHQGMSIVALANAVLDEPARRWGMANVELQAVAALLHERAPREVAAPYNAAIDQLPHSPKQRRASGLLRELTPGELAVEPTHVLSNGRYSVALRANGAGQSFWGQIGVTRSRDDALRDACGNFLYLRRPNQIESGRPASIYSISRHPAPDPAARYHCTYHADRVFFEASWPDLQALSTVWVSPEDDIEFRQIELRNLSGNVIELELMSVFEVTLAEPRADEAHPAFSNLFVRAHWKHHHQALVFERAARLDTEPKLHCAHFLTGSDPHMVSLQYQTDRERWLGRNHAASQPSASFNALPAPSASGATELNTGLDPISALAARLRIPGHAKAVLTFATTAGDNAATLHAVIDKYRQTSHVQRASLMSATLTSIRLLSLRIAPENFAAIQTLSTALLLSLSRPGTEQVGAGLAQATLCDRQRLWRFSISGDRPLLIVSANTPQCLGLLRSLVQALGLWSWSGVACDMVLINAEPASYLAPLQREIGLLRERHLADVAAQPGRLVTALHVLRASDLSSDEMNSLQVLARVWFQADERPLPQHVQQWLTAHQEALAKRLATPGRTLTPAPHDDAALAPSGNFVAADARFCFKVNTHLRPQRPWINVMANQSFGTHLSEAGGGYTWAVNSRMNQLTAWSNDPIADPPSECLLLQDLDDGRTWCLTPNAWADPHSTYQVTHAQGYSLIEHRSGALHVTLSCCVDPQSSVKQLSVSISNSAEAALNLRLTGLVEWIMGANRSDRRTVSTTLYQDRLRSMDALTALLCTQLEGAAGFGGGTAFFAVIGPADTATDWSCDRREFFDADGALRLPKQLGQTQGIGLDPCAALSISLRLEPGASVQRNFLLGYAPSTDAARDLARRAAERPSDERLDLARSHWNGLLGGIEVHTPDPLFDAMVNRWLLYQTVSCRMWAKSGFYQASGATGFRDQLQDALALSWVAPAMLRQQIVLCASRQFADGDVQHWWHGPLGNGVRTHFSDDLLWLPFACSHYLRSSGDAALLDQSVPFLEGAGVPEGADDCYETPSVSAAQASVYEHAARSIDRSLRVGAHGLPLMGCGDWNDGMNRVGHQGRGESVWLGWFLCRVVADFAPLARERGQTTRAAHWESAAQGWRHALRGVAWDGRWFRRAFFDSGEVLGSLANPEACIDLIAQAWAVLSGAASLKLQRLAMAALEDQLVDPEAGLIKLIAPPLRHAKPNAGYIQAYPAGVRENGGQYAHAGVWAVMAQAELTRNDPDEQDGDKVYRYFTYLSPAHRSQHPTRGPAYLVEPYVMAGDTYSQPPFVGRGGWSWYTGAAAWMHRAAIESIFGLTQEAQTLSFNPCLPTHWPQAEFKLLRQARSMRFLFLRGSTADALKLATEHQAALLHPGEALAWVALPEQSCFVIPLLTDRT